MRASLREMLSREAAPQVMSGRLAATMFALGIGFDLAVNGQSPGLGIAMFTLGAAVALRPSLRGGPERDALLVAAVVFGSFTALRASETLIAFDLLAAVGLLTLAATVEEPGLLRTRTEGFLRRALHVPVSAIGAPRALLEPVARAGGRLGPARARAIGRGALVVVPIVGVFFALLISADRVFGELVSPVWPQVDLGGAAGHAALTVVGALGVGTLWLSARRPLPAPFPDGGPLLPRVRFAELATLLVALDVLFAAFVGVQFAFLFGGERSVEVTAGLTYAEYAREGFFQLLAVASLTALVILGGWDLGRRGDARQERMFRIAVSLMVSLTAVILASAVFRLTLYQRAFGWTLARFAAYVAMAWVAAVLAILLVGIWRGARDRVVASALLAGLALLLVVNVVGPDRFVAARNLERFERTGKLDVDYLGVDLGSDAVPVLADSLAGLPEPQAVRVREILCARAATLASAPGGWRSANLARAHARRALADAGIGPETCARG